MSNIQKQVNKCLRELTVLHDAITNEYNEVDVDWLLLQVENSETPLLNIKDHIEYYLNLSEDEKAFIKAVGDF